MRYFILIFSIVSLALVTTTSVNYAEDFTNALSPLLQNGDIVQVSNYLSKNTGNADYPAIEKYLIEESRQRILKNDYVFTEHLLQTLLIFNLDNTDAQDLYSSIVKINRERKAAAEEETRKKNEEGSRKKKIEQEILKEEKLLKKEDQITNIGLDNFRFGLEFSPLDLCGYQSALYHDLYGTNRNHLKYGLSGAAWIYFIHPFLNFGLDGSVQYWFVDLTDVSGDFLSYKINTAVNFPDMKLPVYFRLGIASFNYQFREQAKPDDIYVLYFLSPTIGAAFRDLYFSPNFSLNVTLDYYLASPFVSPLNSIFDAGVKIGYDYFQNDLIRLFVGIQAQSLVVIAHGKIEMANKIEILAGAVLQ